MECSQSLPIIDTATAIFCERTRIPTLLAVLCILAASAIRQLRHSQLCFCSAKPKPQSLATEARHSPTRFPVVINIRLHSYITRQEVQSYVRMRPLSIVVALSVPATVSAHDADRGFHPPGRDIDWGEAGVGSLRACAQAVFTGCCGKWQQDVPVDRWLGCSDKEVITARP